MARSRGEGEEGDQHGGDEPPGQGLEDAGQGQARGVLPGEGGGDLDGDRGDEDGPGEPDHHGQGVDEGLVGDAVAVEGATDLAGGGDVVREGPADEVPQRPRDAGDQDGQERQGGETLEDASDPGHGTALLPCSAVAVPVPVTGEVVDAGEREDLHGLGDRHGDGDLVAVDRDRAGMAGGGQIVLGVGGGLGGVEGDLAGGPVGGDVDGLGAGSRRGLGVVDGLDLGGQGQAAVEDEAGHEQQRQGEDDDEGGDHPRLAVAAAGRAADGRALTRPT